VTNLEQEKERIIKRENAVNERVAWVVKETARIAYELEESKKEKESERERIKVLEERADYEMKVGRELAAKAQSELDRITEDRIQLDCDRQEASKITIELSTESVELQSKLEDVEKKKIELKQIQELLEADTEATETRARELKEKEEELKEWVFTLQQREEQVAKREADVTWREKERAAKDYQLVKFSEVFNHTKNED